MNVKKTWQSQKLLLTERREQRLIGAAAKRTPLLRLVIQDVHQPHNVSACLRSAEAFGICDVFVVDGGHRFRPSTVARGVSKWLNIHRFSDVETCARALKADGFRLAAAMPMQDSFSLEELDVSTPLAVVFGNEHDGVHQTWEPYIDVYFTIPMVGLVESLNISVSAAICMHTLTNKMRSLHQDAYFLSPLDQQTLLDHWAQRL